ncbi:hypothetical protein [Lacisediminimonas sp.]|uniref:hypothetical protein n=1 Tax=Lacisediminimonas sp. TaxID=3060582 RepID=UPI00271A98B6|nr:hypothetical protein [Lacisediminimonas sp.]MDO8299652.1 hypothetical protein [Lacisediminimonas sp.]
MLIEIILWAALVFFLWTLRDNLGSLETELQDAQAMKSREIAARALSQRFVRPELVDEPIGRYRDSTIHARIGVGGKQYRFDYVCPPDGCPPLRPDQCCVAPGIVYVRHDTAPDAAQNIRT